MSCEPVPTSADVFEAAHTILMNHAQPKEIQLPSGHLVTLWDSINNQIGVSVAKSRSTNKFRVQIRESASRGIPHVIMICNSALTGYCPDLMYLGPLSGFKNSQHVLQTIVQAVVTFADAGYRARDVVFTEDNPAQPVPHVPVHIYGFLENKLTRQTFKFSGRSIYAIRVHAANKLQETFDFDGFNSGS